MIHSKQKQNLSFWWFWFLIPCKSTYYPLTWGTNALAPEFNFNFVSTMLSKLSKYGLSLLLNASMLMSVTKCTYRKMSLLLMKLLAMIILPVTGRYCSQMSSNPLIWFDFDCDFRVFCSRLFLFTQCCCVVRTTDHRNIGRLWFTFYMEWTQNLMYGAPNNYFPKKNDINGKRFFANKSIPYSYHIPGISIIMISGWRKPISLDRVMLWTSLWGTMSLNQFTLILSWSSFPHSIICYGLLFISRKHPETHNICNQNFQRDWDRSRTLPSWSLRNECVKHLRIFNFTNSVLKSSLQRCLFVILEGK